MNTLSNSFKHKLVHVLQRMIVGFSLILSLIFTVQAQETEQAYISDELSIFMHAGPGTNYRILGTINAGAEIQTTGKSSNDYSEIIEENNRITWVESKHITKEPGLRFVITDLNSKLSNTSDYNAQLDGELNALKSTVELLNNDKSKLQAELKKVKIALTQTQEKVKDQDTNIKKQWFFNGAIVLGIGLILGLILPKFFARRRTSMDSWG